MNFFTKKQYQITNYSLCSPNSPLEIADSTTPKKIVTGVIGAGGMFYKHLLSNMLIKNCI
jgi:hypothetical protein